MGKFILCAFVLSAIICQSQGRENISFTWMDIDVDEWIPLIQKIVLPKIVKIRVKCTKPMPIDRHILVETSLCIKEALLSNKVVVNLKLMQWTEKNVPQIGSLVCEVLPKLNLCMAKFTSFLEECHGKKGLEMTRRIDGLISNCLCSTSSKREYVGIFLFYLVDFAMVRGHTCFGVTDEMLQLHSFDDIMKVKDAIVIGFMKCMYWLNWWDEDADACRVIQRLRSCTKPALFRRCDSSKPLASVSAGFKAFEKALSCRSPFRASEL